MQETWEMQFQSLSQEDPLEEGLATRSNNLAWEIPWTEEPGWLQSKGSQRVGPDWSDLALMHTHNRNLLIAYCECCWIPDLQRREFCFGTKDIASVTQSFVKKGQRKLLTQTSEGGRECPPHEFGWGFIYFSNFVKVDQSCRTVCDPMIYTVHGILQARTLE